MSLYVFGICDFPGCEERFEGRVSPEEWMVVVVGADDAFDLPASKHFCPTHTRTREARDAVLAVTQARKETE